MTAFGTEPRPPLEKFFHRAEAMATSAFLAIPYAGPHVADFFNQVIVPYCTPKRNRMMRALFGCFKSLEGGLQVLLMRLLPLPSDGAQGPTRPGR